MKDTLYGYEENQNALRLKAVLWMQGHFRINQARKLAFRKSWDRMISNCIEYVDVLDSHERSKRAQEFYNQTVMKMKKGKKIPVMKEARPAFEAHLTEMRRYADEESIFYIAEHARCFDKVSVVCSLLSLLSLLSILSLLSLLP